MSSRGTVRFGSRKPNPMLSGALSCTRMHPVRCTPGARPRPNTPDVASTLADVPTVTEWTSIGSAVFTAAAAGGALLTARQGRQAIEAADRPLLEVQVLAEPTSRNLMLSIINTGTGVARGSNFAVHALGHATDDVLADGYMRPGERFHIFTSIGPLPAPAGVLRHDVEDLAAMVVYRDAEGFAHYRTHRGDHYTPRTWLRHRPRYPDRSTIFRRLFPAIDIGSASGASNVLDRPTD
jgi:hypothetical protein